MNEDTPNVRKPQQVANPIDRSNCKEFPTADVEIPCIEANQDHLDALAVIESKQNAVDPEPEPEGEMISKASIDAYIEKQINERWANKVQMEKDELNARHVREDEAYSDYSSVMQESPEPWVDLKGYQETPQGLRIALDWNTAFIKHLKEQGITGVDEDEIVHKYLSLLMRSVADTDNKSTKSEFAE